MTWTEETTSIGKLMAWPPVAGSVTLAEFTSQPACVACAPFMLIKPSGPRTTPGTRGSKASTRSCLFGAFKTVDLFMTDCSDEYVETGGSALAVTVTDSFRASTLNSTGTSTAVPETNVTVLEPVRPGAMASI